MSSNYKEHVVAVLANAEQKFCDTFQGNELNVLKKKRTVQVYPGILTLIYVHINDHQLIVRQGRIFNEIFLNSSYLFSVLLC